MSAKAVCMSSVWCWYLECLHGVLLTFMAFFYANSQVIVFSSCLYHLFALSASVLSLFRSSCSWATIKLIQNLLFEVSITSVVVVVFRCCCLPIGSHCYLYLKTTYGKFINLSLPHTQPFSAQELNTFLNPHSRKLFFTAYSVDQWITRPP